MSQELAPASRIGYRLKQAQSALRTRMDDALRPIGLTTPQYACLELLRQTPGASNAQLARDGFVTRQTMNTLLRSLQDRGLVARAEEAATGRALPTELTAAGAALLDEADALVLPVEQRLVRNLDLAQQEQLLDALARCVDGLAD